MARRLLAGWSASLQALGGAFADLARAELAALGDDLSRSGKRLGGALLLLAAALFLLFWALGLLVYLGVEVAGLWLSRWAAVTVVLGVVVLVMAVLASVGWHRIKRLEAPSAMLQRRWTSHRDWWLEQFPEAMPRAGSAGPVEPEPPEGPGDPAAG